MRRVRWDIQGLLVVVVLAGMACAGDAGSGAVRIVATTTVLGDVATAVAGEEADVEVLMPRGVDPHDFTLSARQAGSLRTADLVLANGLGLEESIEDALDDAIDDGATVIFVAPLLDPLPSSDGSARLDPHVWLDPLRMATAARVIGDELSERYPGDWTARAEAYAKELEAVDSTIDRLTQTVPTARRKLVTNHDSLAYFADRYGFEVVGTVIPGGSTLAEPSAAALGELVSLLDELDIPAIFADVEDPSALAAAVAEEAQGVIVVELYTGSLGEAGSGAERLPDMLVLNAERIVAALSS